jgi:hypothetical protein
MTPPLAAVNSPAVVRWVGLEPIGDRVANVGYGVRSGLRTSEDSTGRDGTKLWVEKAGLCEVRLLRVFATGAPRPTA